ncbi:NUDIX domain-containing protein [Beijerinckia sp. L45]|uniref:NUDIX domain-containing protein n=1 Tax=Beijerinckia sp. L45 TaxID=1641855 RepID=UPI00131DDF1D|nr:NUDIX domain-containing protein [Beijerinckia sp. L45]
MSKRCVDIVACLDAMERGDLDPKIGLPDPLFHLALAITPMINVDLVVRDEHGRVLVAWRDDAFGRGWHIPGGIIRRSESFADRIAAVARLELATSVIAEDSPYRVLQIPDEGRGHFISLVFRCVLVRPYASDDAFAENPSDPQPGQLLWSDGMPEPAYPAHQVYRTLLVPRHFAKSAVAVG